MNDEANQIALLLSSSRRSLLIREEFELALECRYLGNPRFEAC
jgi:hypothetical protein